MSPAAIVSVVHQQIAFGRRLRKVGEQAKQPTTLNTSHGQFAYPVEAPTRGEASALATGFVKPLGGRNTSTGLPLKRRPRIPTSTVTDLQTLADDLEAYVTAETSPADALPRIYRRQSLRPRLLAILAHTQDAACAWAAYRALLVFPRSPEKAAPKVPFAHRHRLLRLVAAAAPPALRNSGHFAQVLAVLRGLHNAGGTIKTWEWNLLLDCVGKGWRRPRQEHFRAALALLAQMRLGSSSIGGVGAGGAARKPTVVGGSGGWDSAALALEPDIFSYTTLLAHAVRTRAPAAVRHAAQLLQRAGLAPGVHAHTAMLCFFARCGDLAGVRDTLFRLRQRAGVGLEQVPFNAALWAFAYNGRVDIAQAMYRVVRARVGEGGGRMRWLGMEEGEGGAADGVGRGEREWDGEEELVAQLESALAEREMVVIAPEVVPDVATYHILIQAYAYHGDLRACLETLADMLSAPAPSPPLSYSHDNERQQHAEQQEAQGNQGQLTASLAAFRAIFLGFARHGVAPHTSPSPPPTRSHNHHPPTDNSGETLDTPTSMPTSTRNRSRSRSRSRSSHWDSTRRNDSDNEWTLTTLEALFSQFLELPRDTPLHEGTLFWLMRAFELTSGDDSVALRRVFERVENRFGVSASSLTYGGVNRRGRLGRIRERVFPASSA